jgi:hypothetical protein
LLTEIRDTGRLPEAATVEAGFTEFKEAFVASGSGE